MLGNILPLLIAVIAVPVIAQQAGLDRLGALGMVWALVGYFGFLDFGLSRVVTRRVAQAVQQQRLCDELTELRGFLWWWALPTLLLVTVALVALLPLIVPHLPAGELGQEVARGWGWMMWSIPVTLATNWLRGALEGLERFARVNILRTVFGSWTYAAPAAVLFITPTLDAMIIAIAAGRLLALVAHVAACLQVERAIIVGPTPCRARSVPQFFQEGGWITISSVVSTWIWSLVSAATWAVNKARTLLVDSAARSTVSSAINCVVLSATTLALLRPSAWVVVSATNWSVVSARIWLALSACRLAVPSTARSSVSTAAI